MNPRMILGHAAAAGLVTAVWEIGVNLPAGVAPFAVAAISLAVAHDAQRRSQPIQPTPQQRRPQPTRKELVR